MQVAAISVASIAYSPSRILKLSENVKTWNEKWSNERAPAAKVVLRSFAYSFDFALRLCNEIICLAAKLCVLSHVRRPLFVHANCKVFASTSLLHLLVCSRPLDAWQKYRAHFVPLGRSAGMCSAARTPDRDSESRRQDQTHNEIKKKKI